MKRVSLETGKFRMFRIPFARFRFTLIENLKKSRGTKDGKRFSSGLRHLGNLASLLRVLVFR